MPRCRGSSPTIASGCASRSRRCSFRTCCERAFAGAARGAVILPGATLGLLGGGQLGRMFTVAARTLGYRVTVLDPDPQAPAAEFATRHLATKYDDPAALEELASTCAAVTSEFENAPAA